MLVKPKAQQYILLSLSSCYRLSTFSLNPKAHHDSAIRHQTICQICIPRRGMPIRFLSIPVWPYRILPPARSCLHLRGRLLCIQRYILAFYPWWPESRLTLHRWHPILSPRDQAIMSFRFSKCMLPPSSCMRRNDPCRSSITQNLPSFRLLRGVSVPRLYKAPLGTLWWGSFPDCRLLSLRSRPSLCTGYYSRSRWRSW